LLQQSDFDALDDIEIGFQAESLLCWAKMAVRLNASMAQYRESVLAALVAEGHQVIEVPPDDLRLENAVTNSSNGKSKGDGEKATAATDSLMAVITAVRNQNHQAECEAIALSADLGDSQYQTLKKRMVKTLAQRRSLRKHELKLRYGIPVTPQLVAKDDEGWYKKLQLHYFLTVGREHLAQRDAAVARKLFERGQGSIFFPDFNRSQLGAVIGTMELLGIPVLIQDSGRELKNTDEDLRAMAAIALSHRTSIKTAVGIGLSPNSTPITIVRRFLDKIGYGLRYIRCLRANEVASPELEGKGNSRAFRTAGKPQKRVRVYQVVNPDDGRVEVFKQWLASDGKLLDTCDRSQDSGLSDFDNTAGSVDLDENKYVQLCLSF
jgi:hypothetical protein